MTIRFIVLEGPHGVGKTHIGTSYVSHLCARGYDAQYYHFPDETTKLGSSIRKLLTQPGLYNHREIIGLLFAAAGNMFHINQQNSHSRIFVIDRHPVTTGLIHQETMPINTRLDNYGPSIASLRAEGFIFLLDASPDILQKRTQKRNATLATSTKQTDKDKAGDQFVINHHKSIHERYTTSLLPYLSERDIPHAILTNNGSTQTCIDSIDTHLNTQLPNISQ